MLSSHRTRSLVLYIQEQEDCERRLRRPMMIVCMHACMLVCYRVTRTLRAPLTARRYVGGCSAVQPEHARTRCVMSAEYRRRYTSQTGRPACLLSSFRPEPSVSGQQLQAGGLEVSSAMVHVSSVERKELSEDRSGKHPCRETRSMSILRPWLLHAAARYCAVEERRRNHGLASRDSPAQ